MNTTGWECPKCSRVYAPWVDRCPVCDRRVADNEASMDMSVDAALKSVKVYLGEAASAQPEPPNAEKAR